MCLFFVFYEYPVGNYPYITLVYKEAKVDYGMISGHVSTTPLDIFRAVSTDLTGYQMICRSLGTFTRLKVKRVMFKARNFVYLSCS